MATHKNENANESKIKIKSEMERNHVNKEKKTQHNLLSFDR